MRKNQGSTPVVYEHTPEGEQYITRRGRGENAGGRGMDHIVANNHRSPHHEQSEIDKYGAHIAIGTSDHLNLWADFNLNLQRDQTELSPVTRTKHLTIANIPMEIIRTVKGEVSGIKHKTNLNKEELHKNPQHLALQKSATASRTKMTK